MSENLITYNTFKVNSKCSDLVKCLSVNELMAYLKSQDFHNTLYLILGEGSNILFRNDFNGIVLKPELKGIEILSESSDEVTIKVYNGVIWDDFVQYCVDHHYYGTENLSLIPGNVGAATYQNIGAYGVEIKDVIHEVEAIHIESRKVEHFTKDQCNFDYRSSVFKQKYQDKYIIISTTFRLSKVFKPNLEYAGLQEKLKDINTITAQNIRDVVINVRRAKLPDPDEIGNAGSFFKNPVVDEQKFQELKSKFDDLKYFQLPDNLYKIPAGWMIEKCGWKGKRIGDVGIWSKQALVVVNHGNATGEEIYQFCQNIKQSVKDVFGILPEEEVRIIP
ncbi:MAG: UDP-N-acetylmuramate dehydrogenase [Candidatus Marinimicrobia bacterium]|nr:UDP-N-acetylmuramate dehydrogenase [Candidatus Neomarinimicrobiota bacterium]